MTHVTDLLGRWSAGDRDAFDALVPVVYDELRRLADHYLRHERDGHTLQPTALVHEAYLRLSGLREARPANRAHFFGAASQVMRRVLVDHARQRDAVKRGGGHAAVALSDDVPAPGTLSGIDLVDLDEALDELARIAPEKVRVVEVRYFGGLSVHEAAEFLDLSPATVKRYWAFARAWLFRRLTVGQRG